VQSPLIGSVTATLGTQDVNDPWTTHIRCSGARHGVVHVLGSVSEVIRTAIRGGIERRPTRRSAHLRNSLQAQGVHGEGTSQR